MLIVTGPTAVGKTDLVYELADRLPIEIINADMGQLYTPLTIGTAKPAWRQFSHTHHLFDVIQEPGSWSVMAFRQAVAALIPQIVARGKFPVVVGGSGFYIQALLFALADSTMAYELPGDVPVTWEHLATIDPIRAQAIHPRDVYRIARALQIWYGTQQLPSQLQPRYEPIAPWRMFVISRSREELYARIHQRLPLMLAQGWVAETEALLGTPWESFLLEKKIIGYDDIIHELRSPAPDRRLTEELIAQKTRNYAKRQEVFFGSLQKRLIAHGIQEGVHEFTLTGDNLDLYINRMVKYATESSLIS